jgi:5-methylcytosine-specific restriction endonuclease McrA
MSRRATTTNLVKTGQVRPSHVQGMGDVPFKGFQCPSPACQGWIFLEEDHLGAAFEFTCATCRSRFTSADEVRLFDFELVRQVDHSVIEAGTFGILIADYVATAETYKYCILCCALKPLDAFGRHNSRPRTQRQGECRLCKDIYNSVKNQTRTADQHREAAQNRRIYVDLGGQSRIDTAKLRERFEGKCFKCAVDLTEANENVDHTLPIKFLWPANTDNATLLCSTCNGNKSGSWPGAFYSDAELRRLSTLTGVDYRMMKGDPQFNPDALAVLREPEMVESLIAKFAAYPNRLIALRNRVLDATGDDFFAVSVHISGTWREEADAARR